MIRSLLIGLVGGMRSMTPLAGVALAARRGDLPESQLTPLLGDSAVVGGTLALAAAELLGDKLHSAPDRIIPPGIAARAITGAICGAAVAPAQRQIAGALLGAVGAIASAHVTFQLRRRAMERYGQVATGMVEDAVAIGATARIVAR